MVVRGQSFAASMSDYLIRQIGAHSTAIQLVHEYLRAA